MNLYVYAAIGVLLFGGGFYLGGLRSSAKLADFKTHTEAAHAAQLQTVVDLISERDKAAQAEHDKLQKVVDAYDTEKLLPPITAGIVERLRLVETCTGDHPLPGSPKLASGVETTSRIPFSNRESDRLLQAALDAADRDAERLNTLIKLAP